MTQAPELGAVEDYDEFDEKMDFDLGAATAQQAEAKKKPVIIRMNGRKWEVPQLSEWPTQALELLETSPIGAFAVLFPDQPEDPEDDLAQVVAKSPGSVVNKLMEHIRNASGIDAGKASRSGNPSIRGRRR